MTDENRPDWRGGRADRNPAIPADGVTPDWKQRKQVTKVPRRRTPMRRLVLPIVSLLILVSAAIWMYLKSLEVHTHFVTYDFLSSHDPSGTKHFDSALLPVFPVAEKQNLRVITSSELQTSVRDDSAIDEFIGPDPDALILYVQLAALPPQEDPVNPHKRRYGFLVLSSTPDLESNSSIADISQLKERLKKYREQFSDAKMILLVDFPESVTGWRLGLSRNVIGKELFHELDSWTNDNTIPGLVVITGCGPGEISATCGMASNGRSAFAEAVTRGLTSAAESLPGDRQLTVGEFFAFVQRETNTLVSNTRRSSGQHAQMFPAMSTSETEISESNFVILRDPPASAAPVTQVDDSAETEFRDSLVKLYSFRDQLLKRQGYRWSPLRWQSAQELLWRAEQAYLSGNWITASVRLKAAHDKFDKVETSARQYLLKQGEDWPAEISEKLIDQRWMQKLLQDLPEAGDLKADASQPNTSQAVAVNDSTAQVTVDRLPQEMIQENIRQYPYESIGIEEPSPDELARMIRRRKQVEVGAVNVMSCADMVRRTVLQQDRELLAREDRLFARIPKQSPGEPAAEVQSTLEPVLSEFAAEWRHAEATLHAALSMLQSDIRWAASTDISLDDTTRRNWIDLLHKQYTMEAVDRAQRDILTATSTQTVTANTRQSTDVADFFKLQIAIFQLIIDARGLQQTMNRLIDVSEPEPGYQLSELEKQIQDLREWSSLLVNTREEVQKQSIAVVELMTERAKLGISPESRRLTQHLRNSLLLSSLNAELRRKSLEQIRAIESQLRIKGGAETIGNTNPEARPDSTATTENDEAVPDHGKNADYELQHAWVCQLFSFLPSAFRNEKLVREPAVTANDDGNESTVVQLQFSLSGQAIRKSWEQCRSRIISDAASTVAADALRAVRKGLMLSHLMTVYDEELLLNGKRDDDSLTERLLQFSRFDFCRLQAHRLTESQWISPEEQKSPPWSKNAWYGRQATQWLVHADNARKHTGSQAALQVLIDSDRKQLEQTDVLELAATFRNAATVDLTDENKDSSSVGVEVAVVGWNKDYSNQQATAALSFCPRENAANDPSVKLLDIRNNAQSISLDQPNTPVAVDIQRTGNPLSTGCQPVQWQTQLFFRGRYWAVSQPLSVNVCAPRHVERVSFARVNDCDITLSGQDIRPIVLILDWSGSMLETTSGGSKTRGEVALATLRQLVLETQWPEGTRIQLNVFGHRYKAVKNGSDPTTTQKNPFYEKHFGKQIPDEGDPLTDFQTEFERQLLDEEGKIKFERVLKNLENSKPFGITPLASAITEAVAADLGTQSGIVVAITDGAASDVGEVDPDIPKADLIRRNNDRRLRELKTALEKSSSSVSIVAFDLKDPAPERKKERDALEKIFREECGIKVLDATDQGELQDQVLDAIDPRTWIVKNERLAGFEKTTDLGKTITLKPADGYAVTFDEVSTESPVDLHPGDSLQLTIDWRSKKLKFQHDLKANRQESSVRSVNGAPDILQYMDSESRFTLIDSAAADPRSRVFLELMLNHDDELYAVRQPVECQFAFQARGLDSFQPDLIERTFTSERGAPGWTFNVDSWPANRDMLVDAWWKMKRTEPDQVILGSDLAQHSSADSALPIGGGQSRLPECRVWTAYRTQDGGRGILQVRVDPVRGTPSAEGNTSPDSNAPSDIVVEVGTRLTTAQNKDFIPRELTVRIRKEETGSTIHEFEELSPDDDLNKLEVAFTSQASRRKDAIKLKKPLIVEQTLQRLPDSSSK